MFTVKKSKFQSNSSNRKIINNNKVEVNFDVTGFQDLSSKADLRFDVIVQELRQIYQRTLTK